MSEAPGPNEGTPKRQNWWKRQSRKRKLIILALVAIGVIAAASSNSKKSSTSSDQSNSAAPSSAVPAQASNNGPLVRGAWNADCNQFSGGDLDACRAIRVSRVTCQWQDDHVHMTVVFNNTFGAHVTVHMNPIYKLENAGLHGDGLTSVQDVGLDAGEHRVFEADQNPKGVSGQPAITLCRPGVDTLQGVDLG